MNGLIEAQTVFWPEESSQIPHILMANFNLCVHSSTIYFSFWIQSMVCRKHWSRTREYLWGGGWRKESFKAGMTNRWGCLRMLCLHKFVFGLVGYWAFWNKSTPLCVMQLYKRRSKLFGIKSLISKWWHSLMTHIRKSRSISLKQLSTGLWLWHFKWTESSIGFYVCVKCEYSCLLFSILLLKWQWFSLCIHLFNCTRCLAPLT